MKYKPYPKYKDSGINWIGEIPEGWEVHRLKSFIPYIINGQWGEESNGNGFDMIVLRVADFGEFNFNLVKELTLRSVKDLKLRIRDMDLVIEKSGGGEKQLVGRVIQLKNTSKQEKYTYSNFLGKLIVKETINKDYLKYYFNTFYNTRVNYKYIKQTTGIQNLDTGALIQKEFFAFSQDNQEQTAIANFLDKKTAKIDVLIEKDKKLIELLKERRTALINHAVTKGLDPNAKMKKAGVEWIGEVPEEWEVNKIKNTSYVKGRIGWQGLKAEEFIDQGPYLITGMHFDGTRINWDVCYHISEERYKQDPYIHVKLNDIIITKDGTIGKVAYIDNLPDKTSLNSHLLIIRPLQKLYYPKFMFWLLQSNVFREYVEVTKVGTTFYGITQEEVEKFRFPIPPKPEQRKIVEYLDKITAKMDKTIQKIEQKINLLEKYKKSLIHHTVTGKIDVREVKI